MRRALIVTLAWLCGAAAFAQVSDPPPLVLPAPPEYDAPPATLTVPADFSVQGVQQARGNLARWRDSERRRMGAYIPSQPGREAQRVLPGVGGYFALFSGTSTRPGIAYGYWSDPASGVASRSVVRGLLLRNPYTICGGQVPWAGDADLGDVTYLGPAWRPEFDALDSALGAPADARTITGRQLPANEVLPFAPGQVPDISRFYPVRALEREIQAVVLMGCHVEADFTLRCGVIGVDVLTPTLGAAGFRAENYTSDFGHSAVRAMQSGRLRVAEATNDGQSSAGACIRRRLRFAVAS